MSTVQKPAIKGVALAIANVLVIATGMSIAEGDGEIFRFVALLGILPAVVLGAVLGLLAGAFATRSPYWRAVMLTFPAFGLVVALASFFGLSALVPIACVPTFIAAIVLERWTRRAAPTPPVPVATVRAMP